MTDKPDISLGKCDVCNQNEAVGVASVPGIPVSLTWCQTCLQEGCYGPYNLHWINLASGESIEEDPEKVHEDIIWAMQEGHIAQWTLDMIVWRDGYKTMREALNDGPPTEEGALL